jgi:ribosomal protein S18 acetylase RimI-like enzyme
MTAIPAASHPGAKIVQSGIRPFDISRDLRPVAELISDAFADELDERGSAALREMRMMSHFGGVIDVLNRTTGEFDDFFGGFVWIEDNKVVGNITVQRADKYGNRWQIANVAVLRSYRGRGISRRLMEAALDCVREQGGKWVVLQVYAQNEIARTLYQHLGFEEVGGMTDLRLARTPARLPELGRIANFHSFSVNDWQPIYELANNQLGAQAQWWRALRRADFQAPLDQQIGEWFWRALGRRQVYRRCIQSSERFEAALLLQAQRWSSPHKVQFWTRPDNYGRYEEPLILWTLRTLQNYPRWPIHVQVSSGHEEALEALGRWGFEAARTLLTLRLELK